MEEANYLDDATIRNVIRGRHRSTLSMARSNNSSQLAEHIRKGIQKSALFRLKQRAWYGLVWAGTLLRDPKPVPSTVALT